ncbi:MAG: ABC transporter permease subunit [Candidatus Anammoximicrobium sp.]|nr:ABC transporter permease subunit [Candidatus Anammoximicrobium sp.]
MILGPVFQREAVLAPRRPTLYLARTVYVVVLLILMCTAWLVVAGTQMIHNVGDMARFGAVLFRILAPLQLAVVAFGAAMVCASAVAQEKDRRTLILLLMTRMSNAELVLGKLLASLLNTFVMLVAALPLFMMIPLFGGVSFTQVFHAFLVTTLTVLAAGSLGSTLALWREKTFQTLAMTALSLVAWIGLCEAIGFFAHGRNLAGWPVEAMVVTLSPLRAILTTVQPSLADSGVFSYAAFALAAAAVLNLWAVLRVRVWNPSRELRLVAPERDEAKSIWGAEPVQAPRAEVEETAEAARAGHVDARVRKSAAPTRAVWDNPILWREVCTWAYGRKVLIIRLGYLLLFAMAAGGLYYLLGSSSAGGRAEAVVPPAAWPLAFFFLVSLVLVNALAVTSITNERDGQALDLLLVSDLSPREFVFGKLGGVFWVTKEMVLLPLLLAVYLWWRGGLSGENLALVIVAVAVLYLFVNMLGIHCGMNYANSRSAIGVSLGVVFLLFLGVVACVLIMISFSGSFQTQLTPFLAFILGGSLGLYVTLGYRNPSPAIQVASLLLPFATFYSITSYLLQHYLAVFLVSTLTYGFTTAAMMIPALYEFDIAMGRSKTQGDE